MTRITTPNGKVNERDKRLAIKPCVRLPLELLAYPPIARRHTDYLPPFEFGIMAAVIVVASAHWHRELHLNSFAQGDKQLQRQSERMAHNKNLRLLNLPAPRFVRKGENSKEKFQQFGHHKYSKSYDQQMRQGLTTITIESSASLLLVCVGLHSNGRNHLNLEAALNRLLEPVAKRPPVLASWMPLRDGRVQLEVNGCWIFANERFRYLPLPLPLNSATTSCLFLFLSSLRKTDGSNKFDIALDDLYQRLNMAKQSPSRMFAAFETAFRQLNSYLASLATNRKDVMARYEFEIIGDGRVRFFGYRRQRDEEMEDYIAEQEFAPTDTEAEADAEFERARQRRIAQREAEEQREEQRQTRANTRPQEPEDDGEDFVPAYWQKMQAKSKP